MQCTATASNAPRGAVFALYLNDVFLAEKWSQEEARAHRVALPVSISVGSLLAFHMTDTIIVCAWCSTWFRHGATWLQPVFLLRPPLHGILACASLRMLLLAPAVLGMQSRPFSRRPQEGAEDDGGKGSIISTFSRALALKDLTRKATTEWRSSFFTRLQISVLALLL